jgi:protein-S-isoprenylcysteine O-methyltransferase Ste14
MNDAPSFAFPVAIPFAFTAIFLAAFVWPTWRVWRSTGVNPIVLPSSDDAYGYVAKGFKLCLILLLVYTVVQAFILQVRKIGEVQTISAPLFGWPLLVFATVWMMVAQWHMGASWRVGIDTQIETQLITRGVFSVSRNPIFLGMRMSLFALVMLQANAFTLCLALLGEVLMQVQVRLEESHLLGLHGHVYGEYQNKVRRWL